MGKKGFGLADAVALGAVLSMLAVMVFPWNAFTTEKERVVKCMANLRQLGLAMEIYSQDNLGYSPAMYGGDFPDSPYTKRDERDNSDGLISEPDMRVAAFVITSHSSTNNSPPNPPATPQVTPTGLGLLWTGGYLVMKGQSRRVPMCPSWPYAVKEPAKHLRLANRLTPDADEPFWTLFDVPASDQNGDGVRDSASDGDGVQDFGDGNAATLAPSGAASAKKGEEYDRSKDFGSDFILSSYWLRTRDDGSNYNSWKITGHIGMAIVSDTIAGFHGALVTDAPGAKLPADRRKWPFVQNHVGRYNVLFTDGSARGVADTGVIRRDIIDIQLETSDLSLKVDDLLDGARLPGFLDGKPTQSEDCIRLSRTIFRHFDDCFEP